MKAASILAALAWAASAALAGGPDLDSIPDTAKWAAHLDADAIHKSTLANGVMDLIVAKDSPVPTEKADQAVDLWTKMGQVHSLTLFGASHVETEAVAIVDLQYDEATIKKLLGVGPASRTQAHGDHTLYSFVAKPRKGRPGGERLVCFYDASRIVAGGDAKAVGAALDVLDGTGNALTTNNPLSGLLVPSKGSFVIAAAWDVGRIVAAAEEAKVRMPVKPRGKAAHAAMLKKCSTIVFEAGESGKNVYGSIDLTMQAAEDAGTIRQFLGGILAMAILQHAENEEVLSVLRGVEVSGEGRGVGLGVQLPVDTVLSKMKEGMRAKAAEAGKGADAAPAMPTR